MQATIMATQMKYTVLALVMCITTLASAQKFVNEFLNIGVGARAHGMFGSVVANGEDLTSAYWNPAGLIGLENSLEINAMHANWFGGIAGYDYISIGKKFKEKNAAAAVTLIRMGIDNIPNTLNLIGPDGNVDYNRIETFSTADYAFMISYAKAMDEEGKLSLGGNLKVIHRSIGSFGSAWGFGVDIGAKYKVLKNITLGLTAKDITTTFNAWSFNLSEDEKSTFNDTGNEIPVSSNEVTLPRLVLGIAYQTNIGSNFSLLAETDLTFSTYGREAALVSKNRLEIDPTLGIEIGYMNKAFLRFGMGNIQRRVNIENFDESTIEIQPNVGLGLKLGRLTVDYALTNLGDRTDILVSHIFSVGIAFNARKASTNANEGI
ncbi:MAG: PorV/PorQ family protein [Saprospiraceae bacterium]|nr:PorV/PorQ family protein [Saprospiraceae bacterium]